jgi:hypothetical protein
MGDGTRGRPLGADGSSGSDQVVNQEWYTLGSEGQAWAQANCDTATGIALDGLDKLNAGQVATSKFKSFQVYETLGCLKSRVNDEMIVSMASDYLAADLDGLIAVGLEYGYGGPGLINSATAVTTAGGSPTPIVNAISHLLRQWRRHGAGTRVPTVHIPSEFGVWLAMADLLPAEGSESGLAAGGTMRIALSSYGVPANALITPAPGQVGSQLAPPNAWIYMTGPVELDISAPYQAHPTTLADLRQNRSEVLMERTVTYRFDPSLTLAIQASASM